MAQNESIERVGVNTKRQGRSNQLRGGRSVNWTSELEDKSVEGTNEALIIALKKIDDAAVDENPNTNDADTPLKMRNNYNLTTRIYDEGSELLDSLANMFENAFEGDGSTMFTNISELRKCRVATQKFLEGENGWLAKFMNIQKKYLVGKKANRSKADDGVSQENLRIKRVVAMARAGNLGKAHSRLQSSAGVIRPISKEWCERKFPQGLGIMRVLFTHP